MIPEIPPADLDLVDRKILNVVQSHFPKVERPFFEVGKQIGISEEEVISRLGKMRKEGTIRSIRALYDAKKLNYVSTLVACKVDKDQLEEAAKKINSFTEITHNYKRNFDYNLWFTLIARDVKRREMILDKIKSIKGVGDMHLLPIVKKYKLKVHFQMEEK